MKTIALANQKGGVGKTTTAASLAIGLSRQGKKVLLVDADAQGNLTQMLGWPQPDELSPTLADLMGKIITDQPVSPGEGILHHDSGVDLLPANIDLSALEVTLVNAMSRETVMRQLLSTVQDRYDYALIDCMPSLGIGHLRGDFGTDGNEFHTTWWPHQNDALNTHEFKSDIDRVVNWLREGFAPLKDRSTMRRFCELRGRVFNAEEAIWPPCGFSIHTKNYQYMLRCIPRKGDYNFYLYCYDKEAREQERTTPQKNTRPTTKKRTEPER